MRTTCAQCWPPGGPASRNPDGKLLSDAGLVPAGNVISATSRPASASALAAGPGEEEGAAAAAVAPPVMNTAATTTPSHGRIPASR
jgi:hypothetical protein